MSRETAVLNYNNFSGHFTASINDKRKKEGNAMSVEFSKSNVGKD